MAAIATASAQARVGPSGAERFGVAVVIDTETTGTSSRDRVIEIAAARVRVATGEIIESRAMLVSSGGVLVGEGARAVHGITDAMLRGAPSFKVVWPKVIAFVGKDRVIAHNAAFDRRLLRQSAEAHSLPMPAWPWVCSLAWARSAIPDVESHSLSALRHELAIKGGRAHRAMGDVRTLCELVKVLVERTQSVPDASVFAPVLQLVGGGAR